MKKYGKFLTGKSVIFNDVPKSDEEALQHGNALAYGKDSNYPVGTTPCFNVGISGGCGINCYLIGENRCKEPEVCYEYITDGKYDNQLKDYEYTDNENLNKAVRARKDKLKESEGK